MKNTLFCFCSLYDKCTQRWDEMQSSRVEKGWGWQTDMLSQFNFTSWQNLLWGDMVLSQPTWNTACIYRTVCSVSKLQWDNTHVQCERDGTFRLQPWTRSLFLLTRVLFGVYVCAAVIEQSMNRPVAAICPQTHCVLHVFSCMLMCCNSLVCFLTRCLLRETWASVQCVGVSVEDSFCPWLGWL